MGETCRTAVVSGCGLTPIHSVHNLSGGCSVRHGDITVPSRWRETYERIMVGDLYHPDYKYGGTARGGNAQSNESHTSSKENKPLCTHQLLLLPHYLSCLRRRFGPTAPTATLKQTSRPTPSYGKTIRAMEWGWEQRSMIDSLSHPIPLLPGCPPADTDLCRCSNRYRDLLICLL